MISQSRAGDYLRAKIDHKLYYNVRALIQSDAKQPNKLKIFVVDNRTVTQNEYSPNFDIEKWSILFENIARNKPKAIIVDRLFDGNPYSDKLSEEKVTAALERIKHLQVPIYNGAYTSAGKILGKHQIDLSKPVYAPQTYLSNTNTELNLPDDTGPFYVYGHSSFFEGAFAASGHLQYNNAGVAAIFPFYLTHNNRWLPHVAMLAADHISYENGYLTINEKNVHLDHFGRIHIDHHPRSYYQPIRVWGAMQRALHGKKEKLVDEGDIVLIIPAFYTGAADFHEGGPFGEIPGGLLLAQTLSSMITGEWLYVVTFDHWLIIIAALLGATLGLRSSPLKFWLYLVACLLLSTTVQIGLFVTLGIVTPLLNVVISFTGCALILYALGVLRSELGKLRLKRDYFREKSKRIQEEGERKILEERIALGKAVQEMLLPKNLNGSLGGIDYSMRYQPAQQMSGDWLYFWQPNQDERRIFLGDVVGKGPSAALPVAIIIATLKELEKNQASVEDTFKYVNKILRDLFLGKVTTTLAVVTIKTNQTLTFYNAGSPGWFLITGQKITEHMALRSSPLGIMDESDFSQQEITLSEDALFFAFTDGYLEGSRAYRKLLRHLKKLEGGMSHQQVHEALIHCGEGHRLEDDMTMVSIHTTLANATPRISESR